MEIRTLGSLPITDASRVAEARRLAGGMARSLGFNEADTAKVSLVVTEAATNIIKHAGEGEMIFNALRNEDQRGLGIVALDRGPGISDIGEALRDGYSTAGSPGTGLGAIRRLCSRFDIYSRPAEGTAVLAQLWPNHTEDIVPWPVELGAIAVPKPDEEISGDAWAARATAHGARVLVADGLGHGLEAAEAAVRACTVFRESSDTLTTVLDAIHGALRHTRGAAVAAAEIDLEERVVRFAGVGNISGAIIAPERDYNMVSHNGTMGHEVRKIQEFTYQWPEESVLVLHSDGLSRRWDLRQRPGLLSRHPTLVAAVLHRDYRRERDDSTVVVARESSRRVG